MDSGNIQGAATQYKEKCANAWRLFPEKYAKWAKAALPDDELEQVNAEIARWAASTVPQQLQFDQAEESAVAAQSCPELVADPSVQAQPDQSPGHDAAASDGDSGTSNAAAFSEDEEDSIVADEEDDDEQVRLAYCMSFLLMLACIAVRSDADGHCQSAPGQHALKISVIAGGWSVHAGHAC